MTVDSHFRRSDENHSRRKKKEYAKVNDICEQLTDEDYEREKVEIKFHLELLIKFLQRSKVDQRSGWSMKMKVKLHRLQVKWEHRVNAQLKEELLSLNEYIKEDLICEPEYGPFL